MPASMFPRVPRPKARTPSKPRERTWKPKELRTHVAINGGNYDWDGVLICADCDMRRDHRVHDLNQEYSAEASEIDQRKLGEGGNA